MNNREGKKTTQPSPPFVAVRIETSNVDQPDFRFGKAFCIGRDKSCEVQIVDGLVSRKHVEVVFEDGHWWVRDLSSTNGTFIDGQRIDRVPLTKPATLTLGKNGPVLSLAVEEIRKEEKAGGDLTVVSRYVQHYFGKSAGESIGEHTMMIRRAFEHVQRKQKRKYTQIIGIVTLLLLAVACYAIYQHRQARQQKLLAEGIFYNMKNLELGLASLEKAVAESHNAQAMEQIKKFEAQRREMQKQYEQFLAQLRVYSPKMSEQERLILWVTRIFGECEVAVPKGFVAEVQNYIRKWQSSDRLKKAIMTAESKRYSPKISEELIAQGLPPQFFYLALQESDFDVSICGPMTRKGIAKGMWQFIPETATKYGLQIGPLVDFPRPDPRDERFNFEKSTQAAARYLKVLYSTDAQASGLLVMASYNWGENSVIDLIRKMPYNPKDRNFWRFIATYRGKIPQQTYDYVYYIFSAAVIGENPGLFGFDFDNPLGQKK